MVELKIGPLRPTKDDASRRYGNFGEQMDVRWESSAETLRYPIEIMFGLIRPSFPWPKVARIQSSRQTVNEPVSGRWDATCLYIQSQEL